MLDKLPIDIVHCILNASEENKLDIAQKLVCTSNSLRRYFDHRHTSTLLLSEFPSYVMCSVSRCRKRAKYAQNKGVCEIHRKSNPTGKLLQIKKKSLNKTLKILAGKGFTTLLRILLAQRPNAITTTLLLEAIQCGSLGSARFLSSSIVPSIKPSHVFKWFQLHHTLALITWFHSGHRLCRMNILNDTSFRKQYARLHHYLKKDFLCRQNSFTADMDNNWEVRLCYYFGNLEFRKWLLDLQIGFNDTVCLDLLVVAASESVCTMKKENFVLMFDHLHRSNVQADLPLLSMACEIGCKQVLFEEILSSVYVVQQAANYAPIIWKLICISTLNNQQRILQVLYDYYIMSYGHRILPSSILDLAIQSQSFDVIDYLVRKLRMKCSLNLKISGLDIQTNFLHQTKLLLQANTQIKEIDQIFYKSTTNQAFYTLIPSILTSSHYAQPYLQYLSKQENGVSLMSEQIRRTLFHY
jgi:hypothetical protein